MGETGRLKYGMPPFFSTDGSQHHEAAAASRILPSRHQSY